VVSMNSDQREIQRKLRVREHADRNGNVSKACRYVGMSGSGERAFIDDAKPMQTR
jgi:hypothetical protein